MEPKAMFGCCVGIVAIVMLATLWATRFEIVHMNRSEFVVLNRLTGAMRYCDLNGCSPINDAPATPPSPGIR